MPEMLRTIMSDLLSQEPDMVIAGGSGRPEDSLPNAREQHADVLVTQDGAQDGDGGCLGLVLAGPPLGIFAVSADGHSAAGVTLVRHRIPVESQGRSMLAAAIRRMAAELGTAPDEPNTDGP
jgi:DNA-binding NarL/FixJ family response regulator